MRVGLLEVLALNAKQQMPNLHKLFGGLGNHGIDPHRRCYLIPVA
jgi:hypothetical protein